MQPCFVFETSPTLRKMWPFTRFWRKLIVISLLLEIFARLNAISIAFYFPNAMYASCIVEWSRPARKMPQFTRFWLQTERYFAIVGDISPFKRYFHSILYDDCYARRFWRPNNPNCAQSATIYFILKKIEPYIDPVGDISTFKRYFHRILHAEYYAQQFHRRMKQTCAKNATIYSILKKAERYFAIVGNISTFERHFHRILHAECYARRF